MEAMMSIHQILRVRGRGSPICTVVNALKKSCKLVKFHLSSDYLIVGACRISVKRGFPETKR
jgi:hypothetical protein